VRKRKAHVLSKTENPEEKTLYLSEDLLLLYEKQNSLTAEKKTANFLKRNLQSKAESPSMKDNFERLSTNENNHHYDGDQSNSNSNSCKNTYKFSSCDDYTAPQRKSSRFTNAIKSDS
jgi:hypothetical protein